MLGLFDNVIKSVNVNLRSYNSYVELNYKGTLFNEIFSPLPSVLIHIVFQTNKVKMITSSHI